MFKGIEEIKQFILWAREQGLKSAKIGDVTFEVSDYEFAKRMMSQEPPVTASEKPVESRIDYLKEQAKEKSEDEELLFWSSR